MIKPCVREEKEAEVQSFVMPGLRCHHGGALESQDQCMMGQKGQYLTLLLSSVIGFGLTQEGYDLEKCVSLQ